MYKIVRYFGDYRPAKTVRRVSTRAEAMYWCQLAFSRGTLRSGVKWFDGFVEVKKKRGGKVK
jgi:hypothetical protein